MEFAVALTLGLAGGLHCAGMCGPIAITVGRSYTYLVGRLVTYGILGFLLGLGANIATLGKYEQAVSIVAGMLMVLVASMQILGKKNLIPSAPILRLTEPIRVAFQKLMKQRTQLALFGLGMLNGLLPCGLVVSALFGAAGTTSATTGALFMIVFGIGTMPVMATMNFSGDWLLRHLPRRFSILLPIVALVLGTIVVVRGMGLGIPYLSPKPPSVVNEIGCANHSVSR